MPLPASFGGAFGYGRPFVAPASSSNQGASLLAFARTLSSSYTGQTIAPTAGGSLTINSQPVGNYEYCVAGTTTISAFTASDWFTLTKDTVSSWIIINGNLTINSGQTFIPSVRKLFTVLYVSGNLVCNGTISMSLRGANHSGTGDSGGATTAVDIRIGTGTFGSVVNPQIPAAGGAGGIRRSTNGTNAGSAGANGGTGGGGSGSVSFAPPTVGQSGAGSAGTCFSGGSGGASLYNVGGAGQTVGSGVDNGGRGGDGVGGALNQISIAGGGNPGGAGYYFTNLDSRTDGQSGTGGVLIVIVAGSLTGTGSIVANGANATSFGVTGTGSGGGSVTVLYGTNPSGVSVLATGGGGCGAGTARKLAIGAN